MAKKLEDVISENLTDMIDICMEYVEYRAEAKKIFVYVSAEQNRIMPSGFMQIHDRILDMGTVNQGLKPGEKPYDINPNVQLEVGRILYEDFAKIMKACKEFGRAVPKEIRAVYDCQTKKFSAHLGYDNVWSIRSNVGPKDIMREWMEEEQRKLDLGLSQ